MVENKRHQRELDHQPGEQEPENSAHQPHMPPLLAQMEPLARPARLVEDDDRGDRGEAKLETGPGQRLGAKQQDEQRSDRDEAQADRLAPQRHPAKHEQGGDAGAHGRHLHAGE